MDSTTFSDRAPGGSQDNGANAPSLDINPANNNAHDVPRGVSPPATGPQATAPAPGLPSGAGAAQNGPVQNDDPFDPDRLRLSQDFGAAVGVRKLLTTVPVRKPSRERFVRTHPDEAYRLQTAVLELKEDRETYLVSPRLWEALAAEATFSPRLLVTAVNRQGVLFLWPIRLPGADGKIDDWNRSALDAANLAREQWVRVSSKRLSGKSGSSPKGAAVNSPGRQPWVGGCRDMILLRSPAGAAEGQARQWLLSPLRGSGEGF